MSASSMPDVTILIPDPVSIFEKHLKSICLDQYSNDNNNLDILPLDCMNVLNIMINISQNLNLSQEQINIISLRMEYLSNILINYDKQKMKEPLLYIHIPKSGGTSFGEWLNKYSQRPTRHCWIPQNLHQSMFTKEFDENLFYSKFKKQKLKQKKTKVPKIPCLLWGHLPFGFDKLYLTKYELNNYNKIIWKSQINYTYLTILRDPVQRVISQFIYESQSKGNSHFWAQIIVNYSFIDWIGYFEESKNLQTQYLSGCHNEAWYNRKYSYLIENKDINVWPQRVINDTSNLYKNINITKKQFEIAINHLIKFGWIGLTQHISESVEQLKIFWNLSTNVSIWKKNVGKKKSVKQRKQNMKEIANKNKKLIEKIKEYNKYDMKLYQLGYLLFLQQKIVLKYHNLQQYHNFSNE